MKVEKVEFFMDRGELLGGLLRGEKRNNSNGSEVETLRCPVMRGTG